MKKGLVNGAQSDAREVLHCASLCINAKTEMHPMNKNILSKQLASYNIDITPARLDILSIIMGKVDTEFTRTEIIEQVKKRNPSITHAVVGATLRLFKARKLIEEVNVYTIGGDIHDRKRGR